MMVQVGSAAAAAVTATGKKKDGGGRRVMVLADGRAEAAGALQWALSQAVRSNDTVVLLAVAKPPVARDGRCRSLMCRRRVGHKIVGFTTLTRISLTIFSSKCNVSAAASDSCVKMLGTKSQQHLAALRTVCESTRPEVLTHANAT